MKKQPLLTALCAIVFASNVIAQPQCSAVSGPKTNALVELYTSEGCSSCPPADQWLTHLKTQGNQLGNIVPMALHVDYWDYIGWKDNFANPAFARRQRDMAAAGHARGVYTPQIAINGQDTRSWLSESRFKNEIASINRIPAKAEIRLAVNSTTAKSLQVSTNIKTSEAGPLVYYLALQENNLQSTVNAGENRGELLRHDYVVRQWLGPFKVGAYGKTSASHEIQLQPVWKQRDLSVVAFVQSPATGEILQVLALGFCED
ncbi:DUF1223 domain-containing protein [Methylophilus sp. VKM B-3414]|uniref:DUF1223 domain-containing protein n=1 Tax=Methylophilus sp. VKM B-3414 TaxID=3076121 RepID=UPI0028C5CB73|nr:DUF1223 domain-containing protein [Methylophilus sp. VKM B-3414]MDT7848752.1 DUF1223 domain-containing protein [Methylophilus sp. VKM B-3414]